MNPAYLLNRTVGGIGLTEKYELEIIMGAKTRSLSNGKT